MESDEHELLPRLPPRRPDAHKGDFGMALDRGRIAGHGRGGGPGRHGRPARRRGTGAAGRARDRARYGRRFRAVLHDHPVCRPTRPGRIAAGAFDRIARAGRSRPRPSPAAPGWAARFELDQIVVRLYQEIAKPMVFDADALNALAAESDVLAIPAARASSRRTPASSPG